MDCCNYGEYRGQCAPTWDAWDAWDGYGYPVPYAPYAPAYHAPHAHDPYARYYRYDYPLPVHHALHTDHVMPMEYGAYASKEGRARRALSRRDARALTPTHHLPIPHTPPLECGMTGRAPSYGEPQMWSHYQMGMMNGWNGAGAMSSAWQRGPPARDIMRYPTDCRPIKGPHLHGPNQMFPRDGRLTPYPTYEESSYGTVEATRSTNTSEFQPSSVARVEPAQPHRERLYEPRRPPPEEKKPPVVPLPAFQQAFGSTEIGKFAEAFTRTEIALEESTTDNFTFDSYTEWEGPEAQWSSQPTSREIKCEDNYSNA